MENASKALIIIGSTLIAIMIIAVGVYIFRVGQSNAGTTSSAITGDAVADFNAKLSIYATETDFSDYTTTSEPLTLSQAYSSKLNTVADVVTAINLVYDINYENNYGYKYANLRGVETENAVEIIVYISSSITDSSSSITINRGYYYLAPNKYVNANRIYKNPTGIDFSADRDDRVYIFKNITSNELGDGINLDNFLAALSESKYVSDDNYTYYHYYFTGSYEISETTGQIDSIYFKLVIDSNFSNL